MECWRMLSWQLRSDGSSSQCAPVGPSTLVPPDPSRSIISRFPTAHGYAGCHPRSDQLNQQERRPRTAPAVRPIR
jgi:hypothetical protein